VTRPIEVVSKGEDNKTSGGGYLWTFSDRSGKSVIFPNTGKINPLDPSGTELNPGIALGNGVEDDGTGNRAIHVSGNVAHEPMWTAVLGEAGEWADTYWDAFYGATCDDGRCREVKYPEAGLGLSLQTSNRPIDLATKYLGFAFRAKLGPTHDVDTSTGTPLPINVQAVTEWTDAPDPSFSDAFGDMSSGVRVPYCSFPASKLAGGGVVGSSLKTCFAHFQVPVTLDTEWSTTCVQWSEFAPPSWATEGFAAISMESLDPTRLTKLRWAAYQPSSLDVDRRFDFWVDDVVLLTCKNWSDYCSGTSVPTACRTN
jgi:hypothetical protein